MVLVLLDEQVIGMWDDYFETIRGDLETFYYEYLTQKSLYIDYWTLDYYNSDFANKVMQQPLKFLYCGQEALKRRVIEAKKGEDIRIDDVFIRFIELPSYIKKKIHQIRKSDLGILVSMDGMVKKMTSVKPKLKTGAFQCLKCGAIIKLEQDEQFVKEPLECFESEGGCGRTTKFKLIKNLSEWIDEQKIEIQERIDAAKPGAQPERITIILSDDLVGKIVPGDEVTVHGVIKTREKRVGMMRHTNFSLVMDANNISINESSFFDIILSDEDIKKIHEVSQSSTLYNDFIQSIAPSLFGLRDEKMAVLLQLFGGVAKHMKGVRQRGDIHVMLIGDAGTGKSVLAVYVSRIAPRSVFCDGKGSSTAGLTAAVVHDEFGEGAFSLEAGSLVLADGGIAVVDELDKMETKDRDAMHGALEQQKVNISKAGINATLNTRCGLLATANPKFGRFDEFIGIPEQINIPQTLLSRFDLIFPMIDKPNKEKDEKISKHIGKIHQGIEDDGTKTVYDPVFLRKYVSHAKRIEPRLTEDALAILQDYYLKMRMMAVDTVAITTRQFEGLIRLSEASARVRLSEQVEERDAHLACDIHDVYMHRVGRDEEGNIDIDLVQTGISHSQQSKMRAICSIITEFDTGHGVHIDTIHEEAAKKGIIADDVNMSLNKLIQNKDLFKPSYDRYGVI